MKLLFVPRFPPRGDIQYNNRVTFDKIFLDTLANTRASDGSYIFEVYRLKYGATISSITDNILDIRPDILLMERDVLLCTNYRSNCLEAITGWLDFFEEQIPLVVSNPKLLQLATFKRYYTLPEFNRFILPDTKILANPSMLDDRFDFEAHPTYIAKIAHASSNKGVIANITATNRASKIAQINLLLNKWSLEHIIIQPQLSDISEFKVIFIGDRIFDIIATETFGQIGQLGQLPMSMYQYDKCAPAIRQLYIPDMGLTDPDDFSEYCQSIDTSTGRNETEILCHFHLHYHPYIRQASEFSSEILQTLAGYLGDTPVACRIDVILDHHSGNFYLNEIEPYSSGKYVNESILCDLIDDTDREKYDYFVEYAEQFRNELLRRIH